MFAKCSRASYQPGCTSAQSLGVKALLAQQLHRQPSPLVPSPGLADFSGYSDLSSLPNRLTIRLECSSQLGEPHPQVSVPQTARGSPLWALVQLEILVRCLATGPLRASLPGCVLIDMTQVLHQNKTASDSKQAPLLTLGNSSPQQSRQYIRKRVESKSHRHLFTPAHSSLHGTESKATGAEVAPAALWAPREAHRGRQQPRGRGDSEPDKVSVASLCSWGGGVERPGLAEPGLTQMHAPGAQGRRRVGNPVTPPPSPPRAGLSGCARRPWASGPSRPGSDPSPRRSAGPAVAQSPAHSRVATAADGHGPVVDL